MRRKLLTAAITTLLAPSLFAAEAPAAEAAKPKPYPFDTCIVSGEKLDGMGVPVTVVKDGQEVKFCCKGCIKSFEKDPAPFMKKIAEAPAKAPAKADPHAGHAH